jgi:hypothetical protein
MNRSITGPMAALALLFAQGARAQNADEWGQLPPPPPLSSPAVSPDAAVLPAPPPPPPPETSTLPSQPLHPRPEVLARVRSSAPRNAVSMGGATSLGAGIRGQMFGVGFPVFTVRALFGVAERVDLGLGFDSYYFQMNEPRALLRVAIAGNERWAFGASLEGGYAFFLQRASRESRGARWLTGRRNINLSPALVGSYQGQRARAARFFAELRYTVALDTEPFATDPLVGVPPSILVGHNVATKLGMELPLSTKTSLFATLGFEVHGRSNDSVVMPDFMLGLVTSL